MSNQATNKPIFLRSGDDLDCDCGRRGSVKIPYNSAPGKTSYHVFCDDHYDDWKEDNKGS